MSKKSTLKTHYFQGSLHICKGTSGKKTAHVDLYVETKEKGKVKKISYNGSVEGLKELENIIKAMK